MEKDASEIAKLTERILKDPKSKLFVPLAEEYKKIGQIDMAISVLNEGLKNNPGYATARSFLGRLLFEQGNLAGAQKELDEVVKAIPDNLLAQRKLGDIWMLLGKPTEALARYKTALALNATDKELASLVADMEAGKDVSGRIARPRSSEATFEQKPAPQQKPVTAVPAAKPGSIPAAPPIQPMPPAPKASAGTGSLTAAGSKPVAPGRTAPTSPPPIPASPANASEETAEPLEAESVEEIVEIETIEQPTPKQRAPQPAPVSPAEVLPPLKSAEVEQPAVGAFDLSESLPASPAVPEAPPSVSWAPGETVPAEPKTTPPTTAGEDDINTDTLAELYIAQGFYDKAIDIYQRMLAERPDNIVLQKKVLQLQALAGVPQPASAPISVPPRPIAPTPAAERRKPEVAAGEAVLPEGIRPSAEPVEARSIPPSQKPLVASDAGETTVAQPSPAGGGKAELPGDALGKVSIGSPAERRKETIDRLESWLQNVLKEKKD